MIGRRSLLVAGAAAGLAALIPGVVRAAVPEAGARRLAFHNLHTGERLSTVYWADGGYLPDAMAEIDSLLRDHRTGDVAPIDARLLDLLHALHGRIEADGPFHVISGYRSPRSNTLLRAKGGGGVAKRSLHMKGMAIDIRLPGRDTRDLHRAARSLKGGGVGYYRKSDFVHVDVGRVRYW